MPSRPRIEIVRIISVSVVCCTHEPNHVRSALHRIGHRGQVSLERALGVLRQTELELVLAVTLGQQLLRTLDDDRLGEEGLVLRKKILVIC